jgi:drug/metabolite transporter (DMT)-like permease
MAAPSPPRTALSLTAFLTLLLLACMFGGNHVAARLAIDHGVDVATAVAVRSGATALVVGLIVAWARPAWTASARQRAALVAIGLLVALQSACLYSAVARVPVGLALLAFNTYPLCAAGAVWLLYRRRPERAVLLAMPVILCGLALALDAPGLLARGLGADGAALMRGVGFAIAAALSFGLVLALTQHEVSAIDGRVRTLLTMTMVGLLALAVALGGRGLQWPHAPAGWWGLGLLSVLYGTAFTVMFILLPKLGVVGNSPIMNIEPIAGMLIAWVVLDQAVAPRQLLGALLVVGAVMALGLRRR